MTSAVDRVKLEETGWLIELGARTLVSPQWWSLPADDEGQWTSDSAKALRFARKVDADAYIREVGWTEAFASEHMWSDPHPRQSAFDGWWSTDGQYLDPDTSDVPWFDKRRGLAEYAFNAGVRIAPVEAEPVGFARQDTIDALRRGASFWDTTLTSKADENERTSVPLYTHANPSPSPSNAAGHWSDPKTFEENPSPSAAGEGWVQRLLALVHQPNPTDPSRWDVAPGKHRDFCALISDLAALEEGPELAP